MIAGIGIDTVNLDRFAEHLQRTPRLRERLFSPLELRSSGEPLGTGEPLGSGEPRGADGQSGDRDQETTDAGTVGLHPPQVKRGLRPEQLAARFAAKEALIKALGGGVRGFRFADISVLNDAHGAPRFELTGAIASHVQSRGLHLHVSLTHDAPVAQAFVVAETLG
ncbi:holo-ACP synthase [Pseudoclavibacter sp. CFCC 13611]|uniref:holo-ACP synthase n=1 Tax=Pseudoclavibacter sp. CFCC 13611 TaxID=2615178 RepID=UPI001301422F|nr:holo-ACP synthase [Pseudoclavibacter sp. CFCC 13611]KAB1664218.1 holo-ACP synthase [Pseudoclavibacter sp. CFCC 13611]